MVSMQQINDIGRMIGNRFHPQRVILFGSYADGHPTEDSDVDLLVVMPVKDSQVDQSVEIRLSVRAPFPMDLLVRTPEKIKERLSMGDSFIRSILTSGRVIYEATHA